MGHLRQLRRFDNAPGAGGQQRLAMGGVAHHHRQTNTTQRRQLRQQQANGGAAAVEQQHVAGVERQPLRQQHPAGERVDVNLRRVVVVDVVRHPHHPILRQRDEGLPAAVTRYRQRASAGRAPALRIDDDACAFIARHLRQGDTVRVLAVNRDQVGRIDRGIAHLQQHPAGAQRRPVHLLQRQHLGGIAEAVEAQSGK